MCAELRPEKVAIVGATQDVLHPARPIDVGTFTALGQNPVRKRLIGQAGVELPAIHAGARSHAAQRVNRIGRTSCAAVWFVAVPVCRRA